MAENTDFDKDYADGVAGQNRIINYFNSKGIQCKNIQGKGSDISIFFTHHNIDYDTKGEVKTDKWKMNTTSKKRRWGETLNFFFESISNVSKNTIGGPWKALQDGSEFFIYLFNKDSKAFIFKTVIIVEFMEKNKCKYKEAPVSTGEGKYKYVTKGYPVPREDLINYCNGDYIELDLNN